VDRWIQWINGEVKAECLSTLARSGGIVVVRSESMGAIDLVVSDFNISGVGGVEELQLEDLRVVKSRRHLDRRIVEELGPLI
jgi:hypothetical protein